MNSTHGTAHRPATERPHVTTATTTAAERSRAAELLRDAANHIKLCGLFKGEYWPGDLDDPGYIDGDPCCVLGALALAAGISDAAHADVELDHYPALVIALDAIAHRIAPGGEEPVVPAWNDHPDRTAGEVVAELRAAASELDPDLPDPPPVDAGESTALPGGPSTKSFHQAGSASTHQHSTSEVIGNV
jgi:hypothetical protein